jgi:nicotinamidase/pyrazinamidase
MKKVVFFDVDTQHDFIFPDGKLYVKGAEEIIDNLKALTEHAEVNKIKIVSTVDAHSPSDPEMKDFPHHCIVGTDGQKKIKETLIDGNVIISMDEEEEAVKSAASYPQIIIESNELSVFANRNTDLLLKALEPELLVIYGVATDYCVKLAAEGLIKRGYKIILVEDAIKAISGQSGKATLDQLQKSGAKLAKTSQVIEGKDSLLL